MSLYELLPRYMKLFKGYDQAFGLGVGGWAKRPPRADDFLGHLEGQGRGIGIAPLMPDGRVWFAAIDLDQPDFDLAREFQRWIPGTSWLERSRSGNAHVWVFFSEPCDAWIATGILKYAIVSAGADNVEVFPKQTSFDRVRLGNYINLPFHGHARPMVDYDPERSSDWSGQWAEYTLGRFLDLAEDALNDPAAWRKRAGWLLIPNPADVKAERGSTEFGTQRNLHMCAEYVIEGALSGERPIIFGHRAVVYFNLAKQLANCELWTEREAREVLTEVNNAHGSEAIPDSELRRFLNNAYEKRYTSTGCDDPLFMAYAHPDCPIAHPRR